MSTKLGVLALTSMWCIGCSGAVPDAGLVTDPDAVRRCREFCLEQDPPNDSAFAICVTECVPAVDVRGFVLAGAEAVVNIRETYRFGTAWDQERDQLLTICQFLESEDGSTAALTNFPLAVPRQSADFFSFSRVSDTIIWGLYDQSSKEEWSGVPGGQVNVSCQAGLYPELTCRVGWTGSASENKSTETVASTVRILCSFVDASALTSGIPPCLAMGCDDGNDCTRDLCGPDCQHIPVEDGECVFLEAPGVCVQGECDLSPCPQSCIDGDVCTQDRCDLELGMCVSERDPSPDCDSTSNEN